VRACTCAAYRLTTTFTATGFLPLAPVRLYLCGLPLDYHIYRYRSSTTRACAPCATCAPVRLYLYLCGLGDVSVLRHTLWVHHVGVVGVGGLHVRVRACVCAGVRVCV
jgi:hypothetical protein